MQVCASGAQKTVEGLGLQPRARALAQPFASPCLASLKLWTQATVPRRKLRSSKTFSEYQTSHVLCERVLSSCCFLFLVHGTVLHKNIFTQGWKVLVMFPSCPLSPPFPPSLSQPRPLLLQTISLLLSHHMYIYYPRHPYMTLCIYIKSGFYFHIIYTHMTLCIHMLLYVSVKICFLLSHYMCIYDFMYPYKIWDPEMNKNTQRSSF